jgi:hypothetical protein
VYTKVLSPLARSWILNTLPALEYEEVVTVGKPEKVNPVAQIAPLPALLNIINEYVPLTAAGTTARISVELTKVVVAATPLMYAIHPVTKPVPISLM